MRINFVTPNIVSRPGASTQLGEVGGTSGIGAQTASVPGSVPGNPSQPSRARSSAPTAPEPANERRRFSRRGDDRRKQQVPVLIDTRVDQRRSSRRRDEDEAPRSVDTQA